MPRLGVKAFWACASIAVIRCVSHALLREMVNQRSDRENTPTASREDLLDLLNEDLAREYQAIISCVVSSQVLKSDPYMKLAAELETHGG